MIAVAGDLPQILEAFWRGSLGTSSAFLSGTLVRAIPLTIVGVGIAIAFRAGVFNIGGEGQLLVGAIAATFVGLQWSHSPRSMTVALALIASAVAGGVWAGIAAALRVRFGVLEVISTIMLNFVAGNLVSYLVRGPLQEPTHIYPQTESHATSRGNSDRYPGQRRRVAGIGAHGRGFSRSRRRRLPHGRSGNRTYQRATRGSPRAGSERRPRWARRRR